MTTVALDALTAFNNAKTLPGATPLGSDLTSLNLVPGLYSFTAASTNLGPGATLTLNAQGDASAVWIFQASSTLIVDTGSTVSLINGANPCNVYWTVPSSATLKSINTSRTTFVGTVLAGQTITVGDHATVTGRLLAGNDAGVGGEVTADAAPWESGCLNTPRTPRRSTQQAGALGERSGSYIDLVAATARFS